MHLPPKVAAEERPNLKVTVKVFTYSNECTVLTCALGVVRKQLGIDVIDSLVISLPPNGNKFTFDDIQPIWSCAEKIVKQSKVKDVGVSDLDTEQLKKLFEWAQEVKPSANQINLDACCVIPPEMKAFAQANDIKLLSHNDPRGLIIIFG